MSKFVIRNIVQMVVNCSYVCVFYLMLLSLLDTAGVGANKLPEEDISMATETNVSIYLPTPYLNHCCSRTVVWFWSLLAPDTDNYLPMSRRRDKTVI